MTEAVDRVVNRLAAARVKIANHLVQSVSELRVGQVVELVGASHSGHQHMRGRWRITAIAPDGDLRLSKGADHLMATYNEDGEWIVEGPEYDGSFQDGPPDTSDRDFVHLRVASNQGGRTKTAGEVRFIKDRGGDDKDWGWVPPGASQREIDPDYKFDAKNLKPLAQTLRSALMALGHIQTARTTFTKIRSATISPDGNLGGKGYVLPIKDIRKLLSNCDEALSSMTDTIYDEMQAVHWHPDVDDTGGNPRERDDVREIMDDVDEIRTDPEEWAEGEEADLDGGEDPAGKQARSKLASSDPYQQAVSRIAARWVTRGAK